MTCSSNTTCTPDPGPRRAVPHILAAMVLALSAPVGAASGNPAGTLVLQAKKDLAAGDGIAAEARLRQALDEGANRRAIAAYMGEAFLAQGDRERARQWLGAGAFSPSSALAGYRALARLEKDEGHFDAASAALDRARATAPDDPEVWVDIARLRYVAGDHLAAIAASDRALALGPQTVAALLLKGQFVRDSQGLVPALPWLEKAHRLDPDDLLVTGELAATLGELDEGTRALDLTRAMLARDPGNPRAYYIQAVMAARSGKYDLARTLLLKTRGALDGVPGAMLLEGIVELAAGNPGIAVESLEELVALQPGNARARDLLARALFLSGDYGYLVRRFGAAAADDDASPYFQTVVGRAYEILDRRDRAAPLLESAARGRARAVRANRLATAIGALLAQGNTNEADRLTRDWVRRNPAYYDNRSLAGDVALARGDADRALANYAVAARIRQPGSLMQRRFQAMLMAGRMEQAVDLSERYLASNPTSADALRTSGWLAAYAGRWDRARVLYEALEKRSARDVQLLCDLALVRLKTGDAPGALAAAREAYRLQRANPVAAQVLGMALTASGGPEAQAVALLAKARAIMGDSPALSEARIALANRPG